MIKTERDKKSIMDIDWGTYCKYVQLDAGLDERLEVICEIRELFDTDKSFSFFSDEDRRYITGTQGLIQRLRRGNADSGYFGQMSGNGYFASAINKNDPQISDALDEVPLKGDITKQNFDAFVKKFEKAFKQQMISGASRLLTMKRPDFFVCINRKNRESLKKDFEFKNISKSFDSYWEFIQKVHQSEWWKNPTPKTDDEKIIADARMAFLDSIYYIEKT